MQTRTCMHGCVVRRIYMHSQFSLQSGRCVVTEGAGGARASSGPEHSMQGHAVPLVFMCVATQRKAVGRRRSKWGSNSTP